MSLRPNTTSNHVQTSADRIAIAETEKEIAEVEAELNALMDENSNLLGSEDVTELLQRLANAENMAEDMESKVDSVLQKLDELLSGLGASECVTGPSDDGVTGATPTEEQHSAPLPSTAVERPT
ncbi:hypothetical protein JR316_0000463 [Psilocybe cubensis]|uniref:Uncharacterized protein n=2 Tax=Psilocybe cubensis TaxID=181762 RepID=A0A8H7Y9X5_PSICU|nr:hypothetical protein JR316_0000463 [Psilocybe cubensis]KAH9486399.1 hypothetical protein JR316_0000463 [Psilocybe cubensis]